MGIQRLENMGLVVRDIPATVEFFTDLGLTLLGETTVEGDVVDRTVGVEGVVCDIAMLQTPDGHGCLEVMRFRSPEPVEAGADAPVYGLGFRRICFGVDDLAGMVKGLQERGVEMVGEVVRYGDEYEMCYVRGPENVIVMFAEKLG